ncbi:hypothetical protein CKAH01_01229 [Colletotrichum kahawae]|uniref:Uncharacterized protein n=1 Tax=Colletotrichum kahawae TaxID=34407 RepID=A0AAE0D3Z9_COLKA|nr:hypothetical protein CKAH01_01229 [Colletotrichum kahawae]
MSANHTLTIQLVDDRQTAVNATPGFTWPAALNKLYPEDDTQSFTIKIPRPTTYYRYNYTEYCSRSLFSQWSRIYDCAAIAMSAILVQDKDYITDAENIRKANESLNFGELDSFDGIGVFRQILNCTRASCQGPHSEQLAEQFGPCGEDIAQLPSSYAKEEGLRNILNPLESLCSQVIREPEPDIAGPGITMAYIMQIALGAWFIMFSIFIPQTPKTSMIAKAARALRRLKKRFRKQASLRERRTEPWLDRLRASRFSVALFSAIVEFQEAQVFFTLAVQLASISMMVFNDSLSAIRIDWRAAKLFQAGNTLVVLLVQAELQRKKMHWWYTYLLTLIVCIFYVTIQLIGREDEYPGFKALPECGGSDGYMASILETCRSGFYDNGFDSDIMEDVFEPYLSIILISISFITLDQVAQISHLRGWVVSRVDVWRDKSLAIRRTLRCGSILWSLLWFLMNFFLAYLSFSTTYIILQKVGGTLSKKDKWTFGQIVAVLLWAPVVFKYLYLNIFGVKAGVGNRIDSQYKVVERDEDQSAPRSSQQSTDQIPLTSTSTGYKNVPNNEDGREYGGLEYPRTPKWGRHSSASGRDGASSVGSLEPQSFPWSNSR